MSNTARIIFSMTARREEKDLEVPLDITANELIMALNEAFDLGIDISDVKNCYLKSEEPVALLKGNRLLSDFGIRNGSIIYFAE